MPTTRSILIDIEERKRGNALTGAANDMEKLAAETEKTENKFQNFTRDMERVNAEIEKSSAKIKDLRTQIARTGDQSLFGDLRKEETNLRRFQNLAKGLQKDFGSVATDIENGIASGFDLGGEGVRPRNALIGFLVAGAVAAAPAVGAALAGAVVGAVGTGGLVGGFLAASHDPQVQSAIASFEQSVSKTFFGSGQSFVGPILTALPSLAQAFKDLDLSKTFSLAAPTLLTIVDGFENFAKDIMPGVNTVLERAAPFATAAAKGFDYLGKSITEMLNNVSRSKGSVEGLTYLFDLLGGAVKLLGYGLFVLSDIFHAFNTANAEFLGGLDKGLTAIGLHSDRVHKLADYIAGLTGNTVESTDAIGAFGGTVTHAGYTMETLADATNRSDAALDALNKQMDLFNQLVADMINQSLAVDSAQVAVAKGFKDLKDTLNENGSAWGTNTDAALANEQAIIDQLQALERLREAEIKNGVSTADATKEFEANVDKLLAMAKAAGISKDALEALAKKYHVDVQFLLDVDAAGQAIGQAFAGFGVGGVASGGGLASGGPALAGMTYDVGETGRERLTMFPGGGGYVTPMGPRDGGGQAVNVTIVLPGGGDLGSAMVAHLAKYAQVYGGGNVQLAITGRVN